MPNGEIAFGRTISVQAFKAKRAVASVDVIKSPKTGKLFWACEDGTQGPVSTKIDLKDTGSLALTECTFSDTQETVLMLHNKSTSKNLVVAL
jgi:hypothetical protein